jgi:hypothetical protein
MFRVSKTPKRVMPQPPRDRTIERGLRHKSVYRKGFPMLEWKARFLTLAISLAVVWDQLGVHIESNWNW